VSEPFKAIPWNETHFRMVYSAEYVEDLKAERDGLINDKIELQAEVSELRRLLDQTEAVVKEQAQRLEKIWQAALQSKYPDDHDAILKPENGLSIIIKLAKGE
jgi:uncharacterized coiled-coil DUF342 family protein